MEFGGWLLNDYHFFGLMYFILIPNQMLGHLHTLLSNKEYDGKVIKALGKLYFFLALIYIGNSDLFESVAVDDNYIKKN